MRGRDIWEGVAVDRERGDGEGEREEGRVRE